MGRGANSQQKINLASKLLTREQFREQVFARDNYLCVDCRQPAVDAHHLLERKLWDDQGYYLDNGVSLCAACHLKAEQTILSVEELRKKAGITQIILPNTLTAGSYTKWGDSIIAGVRYPGPLFYTEAVQKLLAAANLLSTYQLYVKHPRIGHLPWSEKLGDDDISCDTTNFIGKQVIVTEKMDGENTTIYPDNYVHARSIDSDYHPSRTRVKSIAAILAPNLPDGWRVCGENMTAEHTIAYTGIPVFLIHSIWDRDQMLSYAETKQWAELLQVPGVDLAPLIYQGIYDEDKIKSSWSKQGKYGMSEGYVVRLADSISAPDFNRSVAKFVTSAFKISDRHWTKDYKENSLSFD